MHDTSDSESVECAEAHDGMTEAEAFGAYDLAFALGLGEEIGLEEAEKYEALQAEKDIEDPFADTQEPISIKAAKARGGRNNESPISALTGKPKCAFEQWIKDVCAGRKDVTDPIGGDNSYGKRYDLFAE